MFRSTLTTIGAVLTSCLLANTAHAYVLIDNFEEGSVDIQSGPYPSFPGHWVEALETGLSPVNTVGGKRTTAVYGVLLDWQSAQLSGGAMRFRLDNDLGYYAYLLYDGLGGLALLGNGIAFDISYDPTGSYASAAFVRLTLSDTSGRSGSTELIAGQGFEVKAVSGTYQFAFDSIILSNVDLSSINSIELSFESNTNTPGFAIDTIREVPEPDAMAILTLGIAAIGRRKRS